MTNKAEYPSDEMVEKWRVAAEHKYSHLPQHRWAIEVAKDITKKTLEWALQGAEPVAWRCRDSGWLDEYVFVNGPEDPNGKMDGKWIPLYTSPQAPEMPRESIVFALGCLDARIERAGQLVMCMADTVIASHHSAQIHGWLLNSAPPTTLSGKP